MIRTPDGDVYSEDLRDSPDGPSRMKVKGEHFLYWSRVGGPSYRFAKSSTDDELKGMIREGFQVAVQEPGCDPDWRPENVIFNGHFRNFREVFGGTFFCLGALELSSLLELMTRLLRLYYPRLCLALLCLWLCHPLLRARSGSAWKSLGAMSLGRKC